MNREESHSIAGGWLGTYHYAPSAQQEPVRFEATFTSLGNRGKFGGTILDDGGMGEARVEGTQNGRFVRFLKNYLRPDKSLGQTGVLAYEGEMSEDGRRLTGTWRLDIRTAKRHALRFRGTWEARRQWFEDVVEERQLESAGAVLETAGTTGKVL